MVCRTMRQLAQQYYRWPTKDGFQSGMMIRLNQMGCKNRRFYQISVMDFFWLSGTPVTEVIGCIDPMPNENDELICSVDLKRLAYWIGYGARMSPSVKNLLGLSGFLPIPPAVYIKAWENRLKEKDGPIDPKELEPTEAVVPFYTRIF